MIAIRLDQSLHLVLRLTGGSRSQIVRR